MINNVNYVFDNVKILDKKGKNLIIKYTDYNDKYVFYDESKRYHLRHPLYYIANLVYYFIYTQ